MKSNVVNDFIKPILVLTVICILVGTALAEVHSATQPVIENTEAAIAEQARAEMLPEAEGFTKIDIDLPEDSMVTEAYESTNGVGYVFMLTGDGYGGKDTFKLICSINNDGEVVNSKVLQHKETAGLGSKTAEPEFKDQFIGKTSDTISEVETISGATISSNHYIDEINSAMEAFELIKK